MTLVGINFNIKLETLVSESDALTTSQTTCTQYMLVARLQSYFIQIERNFLLVVLTPKQPYNF